MPKSRQRSKNWMQQHINDPYVKEAQRMGYRSRAACKLQEIQQKDQLVKPGMTIVDLGAAPGGWSQLASQWVGAKGHVYAIDLLKMDPLPNVTFLQGDFTEQEIVENLLKLINDKPVNLVISDLAPNLTGISSADQAKMAYLAECTLDFAQQVLPKGANLLIKLFHGAEFDGVRDKMRENFHKVIIRKPKASRAQSKEAYLLAKGYNLRKI